MPDAATRLATALGDRYRIERELGAGGMALVYLAHDVRHDRKVALKLLRPELAAVIGADRFLKEITVTAHLQHPHILGLIDSGEVDGLLYYVMPYVEGESLRERLTREKQLPVDDAVRIAREVASALDYAHRHQVIHRDIKPENILLHEGQALVADFGIALAVSAAGGTRMTETGMSLGTPHYMSPEQAMGEREITARSDVYALGAVLYEMLVGEPPFTGPTAQAIVAKVVTEAPRPLLPQRHTVPPHVEAAVLTALEKLPADRWGNAAEFAAALAGGIPGRQVVERAFTKSTASLPRLRRAAWLGWTVAAGATAIALWGWLRPAAPRPVIRYSMGLPEAQAMQQGVLGVNLALSPDGRETVYLGPGEGGGQLWLRERDRLDATPLAGTTGALNPFFSPDGRQIAFSSGTNSSLKVIPAAGGPGVTLAEPGPAAGGGGAWSTDGWLYFDTARGLSRIRATGGTPELVAPLDTAHGEQGHAWPDVLPNGKGLLFRSRRNLNVDDFELVVLDLATRTRHVLAKGLLARYVAPGYLVFVRSDGALLAAPFDQARLTLTGSATPILEGLMTKPFGSADIALSREGTLIYAPGKASAGGGVGEVVLVGRDGTVTALNPPLTVNPSGRYGLALSPDGSRLALDHVGAKSTDIWVKQLPSGPFSRLTFEGSENIRPSWTPDGKSVVYLSDRDSGGMTVWRQRADGSAPAELLLKRREPIWEALTAHDGRWLVYRVNLDKGALYASRLTADSTPLPLVTSRFNEFGPALSPDGKWLAYASDESGQAEVYVRPFPKTSEGRWQISTGGGRAPRWAHSGRELFYESAAGEMMAVTVTTAPAFSSSQPRKLFDLGTRMWSSTANPYYDVTPDDRRFVMVRLAGVNRAPGAGQLVVVENWFDELRQKVRAAQH